MQKLDAAGDLPINADEQSLNEFNLNSKTLFSRLSDKFLLIGNIVDLRVTFEALPVFRHVRVFVYVCLYTWTATWLTKIYKAYREQIQDWRLWVTTSVGESSEEHQVQTIVSDSMFLCETEKNTLGGLIPSIFIFSWKDDVITK